MLSACAFAPSLRALLFRSAVKVRYVYFSTAEQSSTSADFDPEHAAFSEAAVISDAEGGRLVTTAHMAHLTPHLKDINRIWIDLLY